MKQPFVNSLPITMGLLLGTHLFINAHSLESKSGSPVLVAGYVFGATLCYLFAAYASQDND